MNDPRIAMAMLGIAHSTGRAPRAPLPVARTSWLARWIAALRAALDRNGVSR